MKLSVIIVNYNVKYFLEHCLLSVSAALKGIESEIFVVDNTSGDGSAEMVKEKFPAVKLIVNGTNAGFAKANNQAVAMCSGAYILYLNPDTIVPEDCFSKCIAYMDAHQDVGALGCRLVDGKGVFLPESKRGFTSARVAFFKISGLSSLFKRSRFFNHYHLGYLPEMQTNEVDVLVGCFMFCRKSVIDVTGSFDEEYFMYGEDIDLSYKIKKAGFKNVYFPETTVIHYKGESTKKGSLNYVKMFYQAMIIFARKHFSKSQKGFFVMLIQLAIYVKAVLAFMSRIFAALRLPLLDAGLLLASLLVMKEVWTRNVKVNTHYSPQLLAVFFSVYIIVWITSVYFNGGYDRPYRPLRIMRGMLIGGITTLALYGLLNEQFRFSRGITVLGALTGTLLMLLSRKVMQWMHIESVDAESRDKQVLLVGTPAEEEEIRSLLHKAYIEKNIVGAISPLDHKPPTQLGVFNDLKALAMIYEANEIIFARQTLGFKQIITAMQDCGPGLDYKLHAMGTDSIIGSNSKNTAGDLYTTELIYRINTPSSKRNKRITDILLSLSLLLSLPVSIWLVKRKASFAGNLLAVLIGQKTMVGYHNSLLPKLKPYLLHVYPEPENFEIPEQNRQHLEWLYARNYSAWNDAKIVWGKWRML